MTELIANYIRDILKTLPFNPLVSGLVRAVTREVAGQKLILPVAMEQDPIACNNTDFMLLSPDDKKSCVMFMEQVGGARFDRIDNKLSFWEVDIRLVSWINLKKFQTTEYSLSGPMILSIIRLLDETPKGTSGYLQHIAPRVAICQEKHPSIFQGYSFNQSKQFLIYPFDYFAIVLNTKFVLPVRCADDLILQDNDCL